MLIQELQVMLALVLVYLCRNLFSITSLDENRIDVQLSLVIEHSKYSLTSSSREERRSRP